MAPLTHQSGRFHQTDPFDYLFRIGIALLPFDNLAIAPTSGWATISPFFFLAYFVLWTLRGGLARGVVIPSLCVWLAALSYSGVLYAIHGVVPANAISGALTLFLGLSFLNSLWIRYRLVGASVEADAKLLVSAYIVGLVYGLVKFVFLNVGFGPGVWVFQHIEKRFTTRVSFGFTEPSFTSVHILGVLLPVLMLLPEGALRRRTKTVAFAYLVIGVLTLSSVRLLVDTVLFFGALVLAQGVRTLFTLKGPVSAWVSILLAPAMILLATIALPVLIVIVPRVSSIVDAGIYGDASLASRYFRIDATLSGLFTRSGHWLFGVGIGNLHIPLNNGYDAARARYTNSYLLEIQGLDGSLVDQAYSLPVRLLTEFGLIVSVVFLALLVAYAIRKRLPLPLLIASGVLYLQFDSYAFYAFWIVIAFPWIRERLKRDRIGEASRGSAWP